MKPPTLTVFDDIQEQYRWFDEMRTQQPVWLDEETGYWHIFRYDDVSTIITNYATYSSVGTRSDAPRSIGLADNLITMDPPRHRHYRNLVSPSFTPRALARLSERISEITQDLLDQVRPQGKMDVIADLAYPLPATVITELLGIPREDHPRLRDWIDDLFSSQLRDPTLLEPEGVQALRTLNSSFEKMYVYFVHLVEELRRDPQPGLMSELVGAEVEGQYLAVDELVGFCTFLFVAGHLTTMNLLGNALLCFDEHPEAVTLLRKQPDLISQAIEEVLRYRPSIWNIGRVTTREVSIAGTTLPASAKIVAWLAAANRDPEQFSDPEHFDITRHPNRHVSFGHGIHFCVGAPLARMEASLALPMILEQLPDLRVVRDQPLELLNNNILFGVQHLPVLFSPTR